MARVSPKQLAIQQRRKRVARLTAEGRSQQQIAAELGCSQATVSADLKTLARQLQEAAVEDLAAHRARELEQLERVIHEAEEGWKRSLEPVEATVVSDHEQQNRRQVRRSRRNRHGDPRFLAIILQCGAQRCRLLGLDAAPPQKDTHHDRLDPHQRCARIVALATALVPPAPVAGVGA